MDVLLLDVDVVEKLRAETVVAALSLIGGNGIVLVYREDLYIGK